MNGSRALSYGIGGLGLVAALSSCSSSGSGSEPPLPSLYFSTTELGPVGGTYDGPAVVERSTARELVLAFDPDPATGGTLPRHVTIQAVGSDLFPVGAKVWLKKTPAVPEPQPGGTPAPPMSLSVLKGKDGTLLLGVASGSEASSLTATGLLPLQEKGKSSRSHSNECASGTFETTTFAVQGDATVTIGDGDTRAVRVGGVDYDVGLIARHFDARSLSLKCSDFGSYAWFALSVRARDLAALVTTLEVGQAPACALGNATLRDVSVGLFNVSSDVAYDGPVFYTRRVNMEGFDCFELSVPGLAALPGLPPPVVEACVPPGALAEPTAGEEFWATIPSVALAALRKANRGDLVAASVVTSTDAVTPAQMSEALGTLVDVHPGCDYANVSQAAGGALSVYRLQEAAFGAPTSVVVGSQEHAVVSIGGVDCDVWVWDSGALTIVSR